MAQSIQSLVAIDLDRERIEDWCRLRAQAISAGPDLTLCRVLGKHLLYTLSRDSALTPHLAMNGIWEPWVTMAIARHVKPGMHCLDVGACYGYYSILMADLVGDGGSVDAWEPVHWDLLHTNIALNGMGDRVFAKNMTLGTDQGAECRLVASLPNKLGLFNAGGASVHNYAPDGDTEESLTTRAMVSSTDATYDFVKIDVEGAEMDVFDALGHITRNRNHPLTVCMEFTPWMHKDPREELMRGAGYGFSLKTIDSDGSLRAIEIEDAAGELDMGEFRMLWLERK